MILFLEPLMLLMVSQTEEAADESDISRVFDCELCDNKFYRKHHLERHIQNIHEGQRPWICNECGFAFHQKPNLGKLHAKARVVIRGNVIMLVIIPT